MAMVLNFNDAFDREELRQLLKRFVAETKRQQDNRLAEELSEDLLSNDHPPLVRSGTDLRLAKWCRTDGTYADAMIVAKEISRLLFGEVLKFSNERDHKGLCT